MKKRFGAILGILMIAVILAACSGSGGDSANAGSEGEPTELLMWNLFAAGDAKFMQNIVDEFNESQDEYVVENVTQENSEYYTKLITSIGAGKGPDIAISHTNVLPELVSQGLVTELNSLAEEVGVEWNEYNENILDATIYNDLHYAVPMDTHPQIMYINNDIVEEVGLLNEDGTIQMEQSPEGFIDFFQTIKEEHPNEVLPLASSSSGTNPYWLWWGFYNQLGGEKLLSDNLENPTYEIDYEKAVKAANFVKGLYHENEIIRLNVSDYYPDFQSGNAAAIIAGVWATGTWESTEGLNFTPMPIPNIFGEKGAWANSHTFVLPYSENADQHTQEGALKFMDFAADKGAMWAQAGHIPAKTTVIESEGFKEIPYRSQYAEVAEYADFVDRNVHARGVESIVIRHLDTVWSGDTSAEDAFDKIEAEVKKLIGE
ncbi:extracellular solute-binding protein [Gracilibacillus xinjiangensis]|uniref:Extracellular solute-binding protein n=1 Tax=Gracilibacillus xinjiangensis TaxID=1193282 RepID=A0ABV8WUL0_9BACI